MLNQQNHYGWISVGIHWLTALCVFGLFALGLWMVDLSYYDDWYKLAPFIHKSIGVILFLLTLFRLVWRHVTVKPDALPEHSSWEKKAARLTHGLLYVLLFCVMLSGYLISTADGRPVEVFSLFSVPAVLQGIDKQEDIAGVIHFVLALLMMSVVFIHALAAIKHHVVDKDRTLKRMLGI